ncbi:MAG: LDCC motif putative metal-binding protein [Vallitaleaceae bacterium]|jgi:hypothetical protein|nr:LDCC motif putative metal-binding protein [Vallitaleaceae bacterium]
MFKKIKKSWEKFLKTLGDQNKETYGEGGINCCELKDVTDDQRSQQK